LGGSKGSKASREVRTLKTQSAGAWEFRGIRLLRVGDRCRELKLHERDSVVFMGGYADACDAGVNSGETLRKSENPRVDGLGALKRVPSARCRWTLQEPGFARIKAAGGRGEPDEPLGSYADKDTEGSHNFERGGMVIGDDHHGDWMNHPRYL